MAPFALDRANFSLRNRVNQGNSGGSASPAAACENTNRGQVSSPVCALLGPVPQPVRVRLSRARPRPAPSSCGRPPPATAAESGGGREQVWRVPACLALLALVRPQPPARRGCALTRPSD